MAGNVCKSSDTDSASAWPSHRCRDPPHWSCPGHCLACRRRPGRSPGQGDSRPGWRPGSDRLPATPHTVGNWHIALATWATSAGSLQPKPRISHAIERATGHIVGPLGQRPGRQPGRPCTTRSTECRALGAGVLPGCRRRRPSLLKSPARSARCRGGSRRLVQAVSDPSYYPTARNLAAPRRPGFKRPNLALLPQAPRP